MKVPPVPGRCEPCRKRLECDDCVAGSSWSILAPSGLWRRTYRKDDEAPRSTPDQAMGGKAHPVLVRLGQLQHAVL